jgi:hypothetical protein
MIQTKLVNLRHAVWVLVWRLPKLCVPFVILLSFNNYSCVHHFPIHVALLWLQMYADYSIARAGCICIKLVLSIYKPNRGFFLHEFFLGM